MGSTKQAQAALSFLALLIATVFVLASISLTSAAICPASNSDFNSFIPLQKLGHKHHITRNKDKRHHTKDEHHYRRQDHKLNSKIVLDAGTGDDAASSAFTTPRYTPLDPSKLTFDSDPFLNTTFRSGYIEILHGGGQMFYWYFPCRHWSSGGKVRGDKNNDDDERIPTDASNRPVLLWLTGGPGCSSEIAALTENGPLTVDEDNVRLLINDYSWNEVADLIFIDQPLGTGFSVAGDPRNFATSEKIIAVDMHQFLVGLLNVHPELKDRPLYITGESYAGHYIPAIAYHLHLNPIANLDFKGIAIGNGWVDPKLQYPAYAEFAHDNGLLNLEEYKLAQAGLKVCDALIDRGVWPVALMQCNLVVNRILKDRNPYDIRIKCQMPPMCYNQTGLALFMNSPIVQQRLGVNRKWEDCNSMVYMMLLGDWITELTDKVGQLVDAGYKVLIYSGDKDFICNWVGGKAWVDKVPWTKQQEFASAEMSIWSVDGRRAGELKTVDNLTFLRVYDAGHMVPMDQPETALEMIKRLLLGQLSTPDLTARPALDTTTSKSGAAAINTKSNAQTKPSLAKRDPSIANSVLKQFPRLAQYSLSFLKSYRKSEAYPEEAIVA